MKDALVEGTDALRATALEIAEIKTLILLHERHQATVGKMLSSRGVSSLEELDGVSLRNLLRYLLIS